MLTSFPTPSLAIVIGATGGIGAAVVAQLQAQSQFTRVVGLSRSTVPALDLLDEASVSDAARHVSALGLPIRLVIDATGILAGAPDTGRALPVHHH